MNILLLCNSKNLLGNKLVIYSTLYCNNNITWIICLTEDIDEQEIINLRNLVSYLDSSSNIIFEKIDSTKSLEEQFFYLTNFWYIASDCIVLQSLDYWYDEIQSNNIEIIVPVLEENQSEQRYCTFFIDLEENRFDEKQTYIKHNNEIITDLIISDTKNLNYFDTRIGYCGQLSLYNNTPVIFWFSNDNIKIDKTSLSIWCQTYPSLADLVRRIKLVETIHF